MSKRGRKKEWSGGKETVKAEETVKKEAAEGSGKEAMSAGVFFSSRKLVYVIILIAIVAIGGWRISTMNLTGNFSADTETLQEGTGPAVIAGDGVLVEYTGTFEDGEVFDSGEIEFTAGAGEMIEGFDEAVMGMHAGEEKVITIPPEKAYGDYDPNLVISVPVERRMNKTVEITLAEFTEVFGEEEPEAGREYTIETVPWPLKVISATGDKVEIEHMPGEGQILESQYGVETVEVEGDELVMTLTPNVGGIIMSVYGPIKIAGADKDSMQLDMNHELAGKTLIFRIKLLNVTEAEAAGPAELSCAGFDVPKADRPTVDVFIMSYCPYGLQMQKAVLPVMGLLGNKADFSIKWVSYAMHGKKEIDENTRQYCIQRDYSDKYIDYAVCFTATDDVDGCLADAGIDKAGLDACIAEADAQYNITGLYNDKSTWSGGAYPPYMVDAAENAQFGVRGSPTTVINGKVVSVNRSPEDVKKAVCCSFSEMPEECSQVLSSTPSSPGIGADAGTSSGGSCG